MNKEIAAAYFLALIEGKDSQDVPMELEVAFSGAFNGWRKRGN